MIEVAEFFEWLTVKVKEMNLMNATMKTLLMAIGAAAWAALVTFFHGADPSVPASTATFHSLIAAVVSAVVPAIVAFFLNPPHVTPPAGQ